MIGLGQTMCILTGGIDLSVPWTFTGAAVLTSILANGDSSKLPQVLLLVLGVLISLPSSALNAALGRRRLTTPSHQWQVFRGLLEGATTRLRSGVSYGGSLAR